MKGDISRSTFDKTKHYSGVRFQQGRVQVDADLNEAQDIQRHRRRALFADLVGASGVPFGSSAFQLVASAGTLEIHKGHIFVDGMRVENLLDPCLYTTQPHYPNVANVTADGDYIAYLRVFERHLSWLNDDAIRDIALGGPDTATREQVIWQVDLVSVAGPATCSGSFANYDTAIAAPNGTLAARTKAGAAGTDPCRASLSAGYTDPENRLYRVEVHAGGTQDQARVKWSRDNGTIATRWLSQIGAHSDVADPFDITVASLGLDGEHRSRSEISLS